MEGDAGSRQGDRAQQDPISALLLLFTVFIMRFWVPCCKNENTPTK